MTITPMGEVYPETGAFPPPYKNFNNNNEIKKLMDTIERNNKFMYDIRDLLQDILLEIKVLRKSVQNNQH